MALSPTSIKNAKPRGNPYFMADGEGLQLRIAPTGAKSWQFRYRWNKQQQILTIGPYPEVTLAAARDRKLDARRLLAEGQNPSVAKRAIEAAAVAEAANTFQSVAQDWNTSVKDGLTGQYASAAIDTLTRHVFPMIGKLPIKSITVPMTLQVIRKIEAQQKWITARHVRMWMSAIFKFGMASGIMDTDPAAVIRGALKKGHKKKSQPAIRDLKGAQNVLITTENSPAFPVTKLAHRMLVMSVLRINELRLAEWPEFKDLDGDSPLWVVPKERMKMRREHVVALPPQAVEVLRILRVLTGGNRWVFPNVEGMRAPMSSNAINNMLDRTGFGGLHCPHGWRSTFSTIMNERFHSDREVIELMLSHDTRSGSEAPYNHAIHLDKRIRLAAAWADIIFEGLPPPSAFIGGPIRPKRNVRKVVGQHA